VLDVMPLGVIGIGRPRCLTDTQDPIADYKDVKGIKSRFDILIFIFNEI
jgi:hypothetical protein